MIVCDRDLCKDVGERSPRCRLGNPLCGRLLVLNDCPARTAHRKFGENQLAKQMSKQAKQDGTFVEFTHYSSVTTNHSFTQLVKNNTLVTSFLGLSNKLHILN